MKTQYNAYQILHKSEEEDKEENVMDTENTLINRVDEADSEIESILMSKEDGNGSNSYQDNQYDKNKECNSIINCLKEKYHVECITNKSLEQLLYNLKNKDDIEKDLEDLHYKNIELRN